ncbi:Polyisoprenoid-binding protein YceI [Fontimonas thermophila]|uniref:Polyisoprenoid-binding protein YceI n=1 Tax=Fontimonas thermophila TaxID=1076937 RepID=A0A1I2H604_9GAMM|nr:YceI family protein [Fontimonas thermophila]SFF24849.1 Polyisoprenoid-binding protein YceI [Fontimonas thermophila]
MKFTAGIAALLLAGVLLPAIAAPRTLIREKSYIEFTVRQMGVPVSGRFTRFDAHITLDPAHPQTAAAQIQVDVASLTTGSEEADTVALDRPWLDAAGFPKATFISTAVRAVDGTRWLAEGTLTIRGISRPVSVPVSLQPQAEGALLANGELRIRRTDFAIGGGEWNEDELVADEVLVRFYLWLAPPAR